MSLFATLLSVFTATAQENTYSIIVKMQNGTVLTIGPNEADSIFFDDGKLTASGLSIEDIIKRLDKQEEMFKVVQDETSMLKVRIEENTYSVKSNTESINAVQAQVENLNASLNTVKYSTDAINAVVHKNEAEIDVLQAEMNDQEKKIEMLDADNKAMMARIAQLEAIVNELQNR